MAGYFKISQRASIALHAMAILASDEQGIKSSREMAAFLEESETHVAKVMQSLARAGLVSSMRGPNGGFRLKRRARDISLLEVYEAIEGPIEECKCLMAKKVCKGQCMLGGLLPRIDNEVKQYMADAKLNECTIEM